MDENLIRSIVRETLSRLEAREHVHEDPAAHRLIPFTAHSSHYQYTLPPSGGPCYIEPGVACNHCGYCQSHGH